MYGLRRLQIGRCGELNEGLSSRPTVARDVTRNVPVTNFLHYATFLVGDGTKKRRHPKMLPLCAKSLTIIESLLRSIAGWLMSCFGLYKTEGIE